MKIKIPFFKKKGKKREITLKMIERILILEENIYKKNLDIKLIEEITELYSVI